MPKSQHGRGRNGGGGVLLPTALSCLGALAVCTMLVNGGGPGGRPVELEEMSFPYYMGPSLAATQASLANSNLMEEGSIRIDPSSGNPSEDFYKNAADAGQDDDVPDAGPGGVLPGWTKPELLVVPDPKDLESFVAPQGQGPVFKPVDYARNPGVISAVNAARDAIASMKGKLEATRLEVKQAKKLFEEKEAKAKAEEHKYALYLQRLHAQQRKMRAVGGRARGAAWQDNTAPAMWGAVPKASKQGAKGAAGGMSVNGDNLIMDPEKVQDASAAYRSQVYR